MKKLIQFLLVVFILGLFISNIFSQTQLISNSDFTDGEKGWFKYNNFVNGYEIKKKDITFKDGKAVISGEDLQPQSRIGIRTDYINLNPVKKFNTSQVYEIKIKWKGENIHRTGVYFNMFDNLKAPLRGGDFSGPGGNFDYTETIYFHVSFKDAERQPLMLIYIFHDGTGTLTIDNVTLTALPEKPEGFEFGSSDDKYAASEKRKSFKIPEPLIILKNKEKNEGRKNFNTVPSKEAPLLPGEVRYINLPADKKIPERVNIIQKYEVNTRDVSVAWEYAVLERVPFWLKPTEDIKKAEIIKISSKPDSSLTPLLPLPKGKSAYFYYYGNYRYGKKEKDLERDKKEMKMIKAAGFTGLSIADDYGLDYALVKDKKPLNGKYLLDIAKAYKETGFESPMVYCLFGGFDKGRVKFTEADNLLGEYIKQCNIWFSQAKEILGETGLIINPIDEPNDEARRTFAVKLVPEWKKGFNLPIMITCNWKTLTSFTEKIDAWVGGGDFTSAKDAIGKGAAGFYGGVGTYNTPQKLRWTSGIQAWASGFQSQAYWHFQDVSGTAKTDLDGTKADFLSTNPDDDLDTPTISFVFAGLSEGLMDLRLLYALEDKVKSASPEAGSEIDKFLKELKAATPGTDRMPQIYESPGTFDKFRENAVKLWIKANPQVQKK